MMTRTTRSGWQITTGLLLAITMTGCSTVSIILSGPRLNDELTPQPVVLIPPEPADAPSQWITAVRSTARHEGSSAFVSSNQPVPLDKAAGSQRLRRDCPNDGRLAGDRELKHRIERQMGRSLFVDADYIVVCVNQGVALLRGWVEDESERHDALAEARSAGANEIVNDLRLLYRKPDLIPSPWYWLNPASVRYDPVVEE